MTGPGFFVRDCVGHSLMQAQQVMHFRMSSEAETAPDGPAPARVELQRLEEESAEPAMLQGYAPARVESEGSAETAATLEGPAPARVEPQRYKVQFTASEEYVKLFEEAKALLSCRPQPGLVEIHFRALELLVATLKKQKYAVTSRPRESARTSSAPAVDTSAPPRASLDPASQDSAACTQGSQDPATHEQASEPAGSRMPQLDEAKEPEKEPEKEPSAPRQRGRHVPAAIRRAVFDRDAGRCTYVSASGKRCREAHDLEFHHLHPYALGGQHSVDNLTLRCRCHNALAAEEELGRDFLKRKRNSLGHEEFAAQEPRE